MSTASPLLVLSTTVEPAWIDYNGHMNVAYYVLAFDKGTDGLLDHLGLGAAYRERTGHSIYVRESHVTYERELRRGDPIVVTAQLIDADSKRIHFFECMSHAEAGYLAATAEILALHVDLAGPRSASLPDDARSRLETLLDGHRRLPAPPQLGRRISMAPRPA